jgi:hypothetical protein
VARHRKEVGAGTRARRVVRGVSLLTAGAIAAGIVAGGQHVDAFKPYTHSKTGEAAYDDVVADGMVTIEGREYAVQPAVVDALRDWRPYYNAGVIGPDGFPDLVMGQQIIHPEETGQWLDYILTEAWAAQTSGTYDADEKGQILAFAYGYLTHAAGDVWAHTLVNEFAGETFPDVGDVLTDKDAAEVALRHLIVEGYIGDATDGYDGNPDRTTLPDGDVSDDETPGIAFAAPTEWIFDTLVDRDAPAPGTSRGKLIDFFYGLRDTLQAAVDTDPQPLEDALAAYNDTVELVAEVFDPADCTPEDGQIDDDGDGAPDDGCDDDGDPDAVGRGENESGDCSFGVGNTGFDIATDVAWDLVACPIALGSIGIQGAIDGLESAFLLATEGIAFAGDALLDAYFQAWIDDIDDGLAHWGDLGLAVTNGLFDPQTRRDLQNEECEFHGGEGSELRSDCEDGVGAIDTVMWSADDFINDHLLSMLGAPDFVGGLREALGALSNLIDEVVGEALNPIRMLEDEIMDFAKGKIKALLEDRWGVPVDEIEFLLDNPSARMDIQSFDLPVIGTIELFQPGERAKLDGYLGLASHDPNEPLADGEAFNPDSTGFKAFANSVTLSKMLLLDGPTMDQLMADLSGRPYSLYGPHGQLGNVMTTALPGAGDGTALWLRSIDADFSWRSNAKPLAGTLLPADHPTGGHGNFPVWESCILRPAFRTLFDDWHNDGVLNTSNFPDNDDAVSADPNDPAAPVTVVTVGSPKFVNGATTYVGGDAMMTFSATDDYWSPSEISLEIAVNGGVPQSYANGTSLRMGDLGLADGPATFTVRAIDPCRVETAHSTTVVLDTTPPVVTYSQPAASQYDTDDFSSIAFTVSDGAGSGVNAGSVSVTFDGAPSSNGAVLDMFFLTAGTHTAVVTAADNVGNIADTPRSFLLRATSQSLRNNVDRAYQLGLISKLTVYTGLVDKLDTAVKLHGRGKHASEIDMLVSVRDQLLAQRGKGVQTTFADRMLTWVDDLIASH